MSNKAGSAVLSEQGVWRPRFTIKRFEDAEAHRRFVAELRSQVARFATDPAWRARIERAAKFTRRVLSDVAIAWLPNDLKNELARPLAVITEFSGNLLLEDGIDDILCTLLCGGAGTALDDENAYLGVGDNDGEALPAQDDLLADTNKSSFGGAQANWDWEEFITANAASGPTALNRKVSAQGTKTVGQVWVLTEEVSFS
jgi:hypothetical protein